MKPKNLNKLSDVKSNELSDEYVNYYRNFHTNNRKVEYRISYMEYLIVNNLFSKPFTALITFGGTAGYIDLLSNAKKITIVDISQKMINTAGEINKGKNVNLELIKDDSLTFSTKEKYDFIEIGAMGSYIPFDIQFIQKYFDMLEMGGIILIECCIFDEIFSRRDIVSVLLNVAYKISRKCKNDLVGISVNGVNKKLKMFMNKNRSAKLLMKYLINRLDEPVTNYYIFLKKQIVLSENK